MFGKYHPIRHIAFSIDMHEIHIEDVHINLPLKEETYQLFSFADKISRLGCISIETAILSGWKYQLLGPTLKFKTLGGQKNTDKLIIFGTLAKNLPPKTVVFFADAFDVVFQGGRDEAIRRAEV
jgi:hypothetical protein